ncbi:hypothetical protein TNCT6_02630 [Streptomyces sp. 6-11-2]|nr:hypothetical protein TNCT6_02630 [Streptomyces sp. 6-11-2]
MAWEAAAVQDWRQLDVPVGVTGGPGSEQEGVAVTVINTDEPAKRNARFADGGSFANRGQRPLRTVTTDDPVADLGIKDFHASRVVRS